METVVTKPKNARWGQKQDASKNIQLAANNPKAHELLGGKTLMQVGAEYDLADEDITLGSGTNPNNNQVIKSLLITVKGVKWSVPLSRGFKEEYFNDPEILLSCQFRTGFLSVKNDDGTPKTDENGNSVLDSTKPYMSFGRPSGIVIEHEEQLFTQPVEIAEA